MTEVTNEQILQAILENQKEIKATRADIAIMKAELKLYALRIDKLEAAL